MTFVKCQLCYSFVYHSYFVQVYCSLLFTVPLMPPKEQPTRRMARAPEDGDPTPQLMPMDAVGDLVSKLTQSIGDKFGEFVVSLKEKEVDVQRETRERAEQDREERERVRKENIEREDAIRKEALARDESLREESCKEKEENLARIEKSRFRDTVLAGLSSYREGDDLESYLYTLENYFTKVGLPLE